MISRNNNFDLIRLFAALQVLIFHCIAHLEIDSLSNTFILNLFPGVLMFFTISGFLIMSSLDRNQNIKKYTINRILRIFPALLICLIVTLILLLSFNIIKISDFFSHPILTWFFAQSTFFQFWTPDILRSWGVGTPNGSLWTIAVELQFYIILPILLLSFKKIKFIYKILFSVVVLIILNYYLSIKITLLDPESINNESIFSKLIGVSFLPYLNYFFIGVIIYIYWNKIKIFFEGKALFWLIFYVIFCFYFNVEPSYHPTNFQIIANILLGILTISCAFTFPKLGKILKGNDISYGMYIYHMLVINTMVHLGYNEKFNYLIITILLTTIISILSWLFIEKKSLSLKNKF